MQTAVTVASSTSRPIISKFKSVSVLRAERAVTIYGTSWKTHIDHLLNALGAVYVVAHEFRTRPDDLTELLRDKGVRKAANLKNHEGLLIQAFFKNVHHDRSQRCRWAGVLALALSENKFESNQQAFVAFVRKNGGIEQTYSQWTRRGSHPGRQLVEARQREQRVALIVKTASETVFPSTPNTAKQRTGLNLAVINIREDGSFTLLKVLRRSHAQVAALLAQGGVA